MIIGKKDKEKATVLEERVKTLERENYELRNSVVRNMLKSDSMQLVKAIIKKCNNQEIKISNDERKEAERYDLYVQEEYMAFAKRYQLIDRYKGMNNI